MARATPTLEDERDPQHHTAKIRSMLNEIVRHAREDTKKVQDPKAQALFETTAEVLIGLTKAYTDFDQREQAWR